MKIEDRTTEARGRGNLSWAFYDRQFYEQAPFCRYLIAAALVYNSCRFTIFFVAHSLKSQIPVDKRRDMNAFGCLSKGRIS